MKFHFYDVCLNPLNIINENHIKHTQRVNSMLLQNILHSRLFKYWNQLETNQVSKQTFLGFKKIYS